MNSTEIKYVIDNRFKIVDEINNIAENLPQETAERFSEDQIEFLFTYFFTESKETRERMWNDMQKKYETVLKELEQVADKLQHINLKLSELLAEREDVESFGKDRR